MTARFPVVVLAGGASRRMGQDKALIEVGGATLLDRTIARIDEITDHVVVAAGARRSLAPQARDGLTIEVVADDGTGPMSGVAAALDRVPDGLLGVVAVDQPWVSGAVLRAAAARLDDRGLVAAVPVAAGRRQVLHAVARTTWLAEVVASGERSLTRAMSDAAVAELDEDVWRGLDPAGRFAEDWDAPGDVSRR